MSDSKIKIYDLMACNVYWDFNSPGTPKEQHKFLVSFYPTGDDTPVHELIERITARGPDGYEVEIANQRFDGKNKNGYIFDRTTNAHWYMLNLATGFMKPGKYTIEVVGRDGSVTSISRVQEAGPTEALVAAYKANREGIFNSYNPGQGQVLASDASREGVQVSWTPLSELAGQDAYYIFRLSAGTGIADFDTQNLHWWDNIFLQRVAEPKAGLNRGQVTIGNALKPESSYVYFTEITDSNAMGQTNICIFQPHQSFRA